VATNFHVIRDRSRIRVRLADGRELAATILAKDEGNDVALLKLAEPLPAGLPLALGEAGLGATVFTLGYPHTGIMGSNVKLSTGIISSQTGLRDDPRTYQISVPVQAGNSGGPLINLRGEVVGLVTAKLSAAQVFRWTGDLPQNVNYAVKVSYLSTLLPKGEAPAANQAAEPAELEQLVARATPAVVLVLAD
jgi:S1-C subfamily serine protease